MVVDQQLVRPPFLRTKEYHVCVQPLLLASQCEYGMFEHLRRFPWVLEPLLYNDVEGLLVMLEERVIAPAESEAKELIGRHA